MRVAVIYRPRNVASPEIAPILMEGLGQWVERYSARFETLEFFVIGGGLVLMDIDDSAELQRMIAENPFSPYMDVEIMPVVDPGTAMASFREIMAAYVAAMQPPA